MKKIFKVGSAAAEIGISPGTIKNLERKGLIEVQRDFNGHRIFTPSDIEAIKRKVFPEKNHG